MVRIDDDYIPAPEEIANDAWHAHAKPDDVLLAVAWSVAAHLTGQHHPFIPFEQVWVAAAATLNAPAASPDPDWSALAAAARRWVEDNLFNGVLYDQAERDGQVSTTVKLGRLVTARAGKRIESAAPSDPATRRVILHAVFTEVIQQVDQWVQTSLPKPFEGSWDGLTDEEREQLLAHLA